MTDKSAEGAPGAAPAVDGYGRPVKGLRLSVTQKCDLNCRHCHREGQTPSPREMTSEEIARIAKVASSIGIRRVKLTGGEPLMRPDIDDIVRLVSGAVSEVSLTTNGQKLAGMAHRLREAGLARVNISLHSRDREVYRRLCGRTSVGPVVDGIQEAVSAGLSPVKVNMVVFRGINDDSINDMIDFCAGSGTVLQLIEYEATREGADSQEFKERYFPLADLEQSFARQALSTEFNDLHRRRRYTIPCDGGKVVVEVVRPMHNTEFCAHCTRLRMSSDGRLKPCLLDSSGEIDILSPMRGGASDSELRALFAEAISIRRPYWR